MADKELTEEESKKIFVDTLSEVTNILNKRLGKEKYLCYVNLVWNMPVSGNPNSYHSIHALSHPEDEEVAHEGIENLSKSLYEDPFVAGSVLHRTVANFIENNYDTEFKKDSNFVITKKGTEEIN